MYIAWHPVLNRLIDMFVIDELSDCTAAYFNSSAFNVHFSC